MNRSRKEISLTGLLTILLASTTSCMEYTRLPRSDWNAESSESTGDWRIKTATTVYFVRRFTTTDSTVVLLDTSRMERVGGASYPASAVSAIRNSELPIVLAARDVETIEFGRVSTGRTIGAILGGTAAVCACIVFYFLTTADWYG